MELLLSYLTPSITAEIVCFLFSLICLLRDKTIMWKSMIVYLLVTCIAEISGRYFGKTYHNSQWVYNIFILFEFGFTTAMFHYLYRNYTYRRYVIIPGIVLFIILYIVCLLNNGVLVYSNLTFAVMSVLFSLYSLFYYYLLLKDEAYTRLSLSAEFWWVAGTLFFYFGTTACNLFNDQLDAITISPSHHLSYFIFKGLNVILYSLWSFAFVCRRWFAK
jgi:hypothetical protein